MRNSNPVKGFPSTPLVAVLTVDVIETSLHNYDIKTSEDNLRANTLNIPCELNNFYHVVSWLKDNDI